MVDYAISIVIRQHFIQIISLEIEGKIIISEEIKRIITVFITV